MKDTYELQMKIRDFRGGKWGPWTDDGCGGVFRSGLPALIRLVKDSDKHSTDRYRIVRVRRSVLRLKPTPKK